MIAGTGIAETVRDENKKEKRKEATAKRNCNLEIGNWKSQIALCASLRRAMILLLNNSKTRLETFN